VPAITLSPAAALTVITMAGIGATSEPAWIAAAGQGNVSRAVRLITRFLGDHTGAESAHIIVDAQNAASLRVARAVGAKETDRWQNDDGRTMVRHVLALRSIRWSGRRPA
jgi:RimJ/RimL family protein N-acetyltransferase